MLRDSSQKIKLLKIMETLRQALQAGKQASFCYFDKDETGNYLMCYSLDDSEIDKYTEQVFSSEKRMILWK